MDYGSQVPKFGDCFDSVSRDRYICCKIARSQILYLCFFAMISADRGNAYGESNFWLPSSAEK